MRPRIGVRMPVPGEPNKLPADPIDPKNSYMAMAAPIVASVLVSAAVGSYVTGESLMSVATAMNGALGAAAGVAIGHKIGGDYHMAAAFGLGVAVPAIVGGTFDTAAFALGAGAFGGSYAAMQYSGYLPQ